MNTDIDKALKGPRLVGGAFFATRAPRISEERLGKAYFLEGLVCNQCGGAAVNFRGEGTLVRGGGGKFAVVCPVCDNKAAGTFGAEASMDSLEGLIREFCLASICRKQELIE